jgi:membrane protein DedA with SNARE-associated domain
LVPHITPMPKVKYYLKLLYLPLSLFVISISLVLIWNLFNLPPLDVLLTKVKYWFDLYGLPLLFVSAILEGMLLVCGYFPGLFVIFVSVILADSPFEAITAVIVGTLGLIVAHSINYILGKYGWYQLLVKFGLKTSIEESRDNLISKGHWTIWSSYWLPSMSALTDTAAGIIHMPFRKFIFHSTFASFAWNSFVGIIVYLIGEPALYVVGVGGNSDLVVPITAVVIWSAALLVIDYWKKHKAPLQPIP